MILILYKCSLLYTNVLYSRDSVLFNKATLQCTTHECYPKQKKSLNQMSGVPFVES